MSAFVTEKVKGIDRCLLAANLSPDRLHLHLSELAPGTSAHPPHDHQGVEAFYILEGQGVLDTGGERYELQANEAIVLDATQPHGLQNTGSGNMRYLVIIAKP